MELLVVLLLMTPGTMICTGGLIYNRILGRKSTPDSFFIQENSPVM